MPRVVTAEELEPIIDVIRRFSGGARISEIEKTIQPHIPRRTLQRYLAELRRQGRLRQASLRYFVVEHIPAERKVLSLSERDRIIPLSIAGERIRQSVSRELARRKPVGYNRKFLESYRPNETWYLPEHVRRKLHDMGRLPDDAQPRASTYSRKILHRLLIDLSWNSSRLEGNTYSLLETERLIEFGESAKGRDALEAQMILNHKAAIELLAEGGPDIGFNRYTVCNLHALLSDNLLPDPQACGRLRSMGVGIDGSVFHPLEGPQQIEEEFQRYLEIASVIGDPFEQSFFMLVHLPYLQPFDDVNKRVSRLSANLPLMQNTLCPLSFVDVPERDYVNGILGVYELNRVELLRDVYVWAYERSCSRYAAVRQSLGEPDPFRLRYRKEIYKAVEQIVRAIPDPQDAGNVIEGLSAKRVPEEDTKRFRETVENELLTLDEGNIARYRLRPSEFKAWCDAWGRKES